MSIASTAAVPVPASYAKDLPGYDVLIKFYGSPVKTGVAANPKVAGLVGEYLSSEEHRLIALAKTDARFLMSPLGSTTINLTDPDVLKCWMDPLCRTEVNIKVAERIAKRAYEVPVRSLRSVEGVFFPLPTELVAYAMKSMPTGGVAVEFGSGLGEVGILMGFSRAREVCLNDIEEGLVDGARMMTRMMSVPEEVTRKYQYISDSCLNFLKHRPDLKRQVNVALCFNLFHFLEPEERPQFYALLKALLKPKTPSEEGGQAIITTNSSFDSGVRHIFNEFSLETEATVYQLSLQDQSEIELIYEKIVPVNTNRDAKPAYYILSERKPGKKWEECPNALQKIGPKLKKQIKEEMDRVRQKIDEVQCGSIILRRAKACFFNLHSLRSLFEQNGFEVVTTFTTQLNGHLCFPLNPYASGDTNSVGIIVRLPAAAAAAPQPTTTAAK
jgi:hypothetical protein